ncbi:hypothetical protein AS850_07490 [Frondihabitans sp. 762G35]|uniref:PH-like domain-containing protein n=1 Tax=Frondihabitans sp. 762G35 TaxID=1446794 RepID=UPI000D20913F|nr:hypothetical protein [Frondihabitans sp. 762G35]ARC56919.1 hypothetical protein AS850_07490 [Frondihabitans sp. 762G35]
MTRWLIGAGFLLLFLALFLLMRAGWRARGRSQAGLPLPVSAPVDLAPSSFERDLFYVATSKAENPLDRVVVRGLGFRGRAVVEVHPEGVVLDIAGAAPILVERASLRDVGRSTWTIDRVVETDGLIRIGWRLGDTDVDTYLRDSGDPREVIDAVETLLPDAAPAPRTDTTPGEKTQ